MLKNAPAPRYRLIPEDVWREAVDRVLSGESAKSVAKDLGIPRTSLRRKVDLVKGNDNAELGTFMGVKPIFSIDEEKTLADFLEQSSKMFHGLTTTAVRQLAYDMAKLIKLKCPNHGLTMERKA